ncbi:MAG: two-component system sensor histidine kinase NtrB [Chloroflexota bacterium]
MPGAREVSRKIYLYLIVILAAATVVTALSTFFHYRSSLQAAERSLQLEALGIAASLEATLGRIYPSGGKVFRDLITEGTWEGIAFIALYDREGRTLLHSNEHLVGKRVDDDSLRRAAESGEPQFDYRVLGTDEKVFILDYPVILQGHRAVLRLALHTHPVEAVTRQAAVQIGSIAVLVVLLWIIGFFFMKAFTRAERLKGVVEERERLALLGEMASVLAHEIRNPLGSIKGFAQYLIEVEEKNEVTDDLLRDYLTIIVLESQRLEALTDDLLSYAKPPEVRRAPLNLRDLAEEVRVAFSRHERAGAVIVENSVPDISVESDKDKVKQILTNVLENALDSMPEGGVIEITAKRDDGSVALTVTDSGLGMDDETKARAFTPFFTTKTRGTGLGLAVVDRLVRALGGEIRLETKPGTGTRFTVVLPLRE